MQVASKRVKRQKRFSRKDDNRLDFAKGKFSRELVLKVFSFLSLKDLIHCTAVSLEWSRMANDEMLWKPLFHQRFRDPVRRGSFEQLRRASVTRYGGSWKTKYRIHHNWLLGNCFINDIVNTTLQNNTSILHLQITHDIIYLVQNNAAHVDVWRFTENESSLLLKLHAMNNVNITFLKLMEGHLVAGYSNGGFTVWKINGTNYLDLEISEIVNEEPISTVDDKVISVAMEYPMIVVCTESMKLSVFYIDVTIRLVHRLQSPIDWSPVLMDIQLVDDRRHVGYGDLWKVIVCFGLSGGNFTSSIGVQELVLSSRAVISSKNGFVMDYERIYPSSNRPITSSDQITSMVYAPPYLITAHPNNTMKQYNVAITDNALNISFLRTLYGHTFKVDALAVDAAQHKLMSGDRSGIKIWDLLTGECQVTLHNHRNQSDLKELPNLRIKSLAYDEDKIMAVVNSPNNSFVRLWSFDTLLK